MDRNFKQCVLAKLNEYKYSDFSFTVEEGVRLRVPKACESEVSLLMNWRNTHCYAYPTQFEATFQGTENWLRESVFKKEDRILFFVETDKGEIIGHLGLSNFNFDKKSCELDNVVRGLNNVRPGVMTKAVETILKLAFGSLDMEEIILKVFSDNERAIRFYQKCGFQGIGQIPLKKEISEDMIKYSEIKGEVTDEPDKIFNVMQIKRRQK